MVSQLREYGIGLPVKCVFPLRMIFFNLEHPWKAPASISTTLAGMLISCNFLHLSNACCLITVNVSGKEMYCKFSQPTKVYSSIVWIPSSRSISLNLEFAKAYGAGSGLAKHH